MNAPKLFKAFLPILILAMGVVGVRVLMSLKKPAEKKEIAARVDTVEFIRVESGQPRARIAATGVVEGDKQVALSALVAGEVVYVSDDLVPGGRFSRGSTILRVDPRDYEIAVDQERSRVQQAELELSLEEQRASTAQREWELLGGGEDPANAPLALRKPQLEAVKRKLQASRAGLKRAELNLERASLKAPFNSLVLMETVDVGQLLSPGAGVVTLVGTDRFRVKVSIPVEQLANVGIPGVNGHSGSAATVVQDLGNGQSITRTGSVLQLAGQLDPQTRTADLYIGIDAPLAGPGLPLLPGAFVQVDIDGEPVPGAIEVPRDVLVEGDVIWTVTPEDTLARNEVTVGWRDAEAAFIVAGLADGARVVTVPPSLPIDGAPVKARAQGAAPQEPQNGEPSASADAPKGTEG